MRRSSGTISLAGLAACATILAACGGSSGNGSPPPPTPPTGLAAEAADRAVALTWTATSGATSYSVYRAASTGALSTKTKIGTATSPSYGDTAVTNAVTYYYQVTASNAGGESAGSNEVSATPASNLPPVAPTGVTATPALGQVTLSWSAVPSATSYTIYWATSAGVTKSSPSPHTTASTTYVDSGLTNGTTYYYAITASNPNGESPLSAEVSATPNLPQPYVAATVLRWTPPMPTNVPIVQVRVCADASCSAVVSDATVTVNSTSVPWNAGNGDYESAQVIAAGAAVALSVTVPAGSSAAAGTYTASGQMYATAPTVTAPTSSTTWARSADNVVTWTAGAPTSTSPASIYVVGIQDAGGTFYPINANTSPAVAAITDSSYTLPTDTLPSAGPYTVFVGIGTQGIVGDAGGGIPVSGAATGSSLYLGYCSATVSFDVTAAPPAPPTGVVATAGDGSVSLAWNASAGATSYGVYRGTASGGLGTKTLVGTVSSGLTFADTTVANGTTYYYQLVASNGNGDSAGSAEVSATPTAAPPPPFINAESIRWNLPKVSGVPIQQVQVCTDSSCATAVSDATVQMNTTTLTWNATNQRYEGNVMPAAGYHVTLTVTIPAGSIVAAGTYTATVNTYSTAPAVTLPTSSTTWSRAVAHDLTWTAGSPTATTPASVYVVGINDSVGNFYPTKTNNGPTEVPVTSTTFTLPAGSLPAAGTYVAWIGIATNGIVDGGGGVAIPGAAAGSGLYTGYVSAYVAFTVTD
jgi:fibronectin type 3 domain-containing protein